MGNDKARLLEVKNMKKLHEEMSWNEFYERYTINYEEFVFSYKNYRINLCYGKEGSFSYNLVKNGKIIEQNEYSSPNKLLELARFDGLKFEEIYNELF